MDQLMHEVSNVRFRTYRRRNIIKNGSLNILLYRKQIIKVNLIIIV